MAAGTVRGPLRAVLLVRDLDGQREAEVRAVRLGDVHVQRQLVAA